MTLAAELPTPAELLAARAFLASRHPPTPLTPSPALGERYGCTVYVKHETMGPVRSFKARGPLYALAQLSPDERARGVVTASTGNHGQGVAYAGATVDTPVTVLAPAATPRVKADAMRRFGADLRLVDGDLSHAVAEARQLAADSGGRYVEDGEDRDLMAGVASVGFEILEQCPAVDTILAPVGGGNLLSGIALAARRLNPDVAIVGVQSDAAPAAARSYAARRLVEAPCATFAGGLATSVPGSLALRAMLDLVDDVVLVSDADLRRQLVAMLEAPGVLAEGAAAAPFAALAADPGRFRGRTVALVLSGSNIDPEELRGLLGASHTAAAP